MQTLSKNQIEKIALKVAAILSERVDGDPEDFNSWLRAGDGICSLLVVWDRGDELTRYPSEWGRCAAEEWCGDCSPRIVVSALGDWRRPKHLAQLLIHELSHAVLEHFAPEVFLEAVGETPWLAVDYTYNAHENICRAVERYFLGSFGRGWLPAHGVYWH